MRIVTKTIFYKLPAGILYSDYQPDVIENLKIKGDTIMDGDIPIDFWYQDLIGNISAEDSLKRNDITTKSMIDQSSFELDFDVGERDGLFEKDSLYAIYEHNDIIGLVKTLESCYQRDYFNHFDNQLEFFISGNASNRKKEKYSDSK